MKDKEKQTINEIKRIIDDRCEAELGQVHANSKDGKVTKTVDTILIAKDIYKYLYEKFEKNKQAMAYRIVELEKLLDAKCDRCIERERKETAEKIYLQAKTIVDNTKYIVQGREYLHIDALKEIIKSCGVEIKE